MIYFNSLVKGFNFLKELNIRIKKVIIYMYAKRLIDHLCSYLLMLKCWTDVPSDRPTFSEITEEIKQFTSTEESSDVSQPLQTKIEPGGSEEYLGVMG